jgi:parallel beta-helix repeat protein
MTIRNSAAKSISRILRLESLESREVPSVSPVAAAAHRVIAVRQSNPHARFHTIQAAINAARPGDEIRIYSGIYREALTVTKNNLTIDVAPGADVVIQNPGQMGNGITVAGPGGTVLTGFTLSGVTVKGFSASGVFLSDATNFTIGHVVAANNLSHGIEAVYASNGSIHDCTAYGSDNTGIEVSQSSNVLVTSDNVHGNTNGIEILNCTRVTTSDCSAFDNTVGIVVDQLPGAAVVLPGHKPVQTSSYNVVEKNQVYANNLTNMATSTMLPLADPPGAGILIVGGDHTLVESNQVYSNAYSGIVVISGANWLALAPVGTPHYARGVNFNPRYTLVEDNNLWFNGYITGALGWPQPGDLVWTGQGKHNLWVKNLYTNSSPELLP